VTDQPYRLRWPLIGSPDAADVEAQAEALEALAGQLRTIAAAIHSGHHEYDPPVSEMLETLGQMADADRRMRRLIADLAGRWQPGSRAGTSANVVQFGAEGPTVRNRTVRSRIFGQISP
jgi:hypothetical protein